ncbi:MAG: CapA family protein, partial [Deltaproteobacteria bacterium]|nr:CapA family protein [Deltaproteobacteria bacterium]
MEDPSKLVVDSEVVVFSIPPQSPTMENSSSELEGKGQDSEAFRGQASGKDNLGVSRENPKGSPRHTRVLFIGDIMCHGEQLKHAKKDSSWEFRTQFQRIKPYMTDSMVVGNLETTFAGDKAKYSGYPTFNTPDSLATALVDLGVHIVTLANNHIFDKGNAGAQRTIEVLDANGIIWTGLGTQTILSNQPLLLEYDGIKWALLNYSYGSNTSLPKADKPENLRLNVISEESVLEGL